MSRLPLFVMVLSLAIIILVPAAGFGEGPSSSIAMGSEDIIIDVDSTLPGFQGKSFNFTDEAGGNVTSQGAFFFEARIRMNDSAFMVPAVTVETNTTGNERMHNVTSVSIYFPGSAPIVYHGPIDRQWSSSSNNQSKLFVDSSLPPIIVPRGGMLSMTFGTFGLSYGDQIKVTFAYIANAGSTAATEVIPVVDVSRSPLDVASIFAKIETKGNLTADVFIEPEAHCELCIQIKYEPGNTTAEASYAGSEVHIIGASSVEFLARGEEGGEIAIFKAAGVKAPDGMAVAYANSTQVTLDKEWKRYSIGLPEGKDLYSVSRPFSVDFAGNSNAQTIYLKGITYN